MTDTPRPRTEEPADAAKERASGRRARYETPRLTDYGSVAKITQSGGASTADGPVGFMMN
jgi:hypothetical protein